MECSDTGWDMLIAYAFGPRRLSRADRTFDSDGTTAAAQRSHRTAHRLTGDELDDVESDVNEYLEAVQVPPRPPGYRWFLEFPDEASADDWESRIHMIAQRMQPPFAAPCRAQMRDEFCARLREEFAIPESEAVWAHPWVGSPGDERRRR